MKKRKNGTGTVVKLSGDRYEPYVARLLIGKNIEGKPIYYDIDTFKEELDAIVCLENYHKNPYTLYVKEEKYNRIATFPNKPYPLAPVKNPNNIIIEKVKKDNYTFKQLYEDFKKVKMLTKEEGEKDRLYHIRPKNKSFGYHYCRSMITAFNNSKSLHNKLYKDLRLSDFKQALEESQKSKESQRQMINLFTNLDKFALEEDIIEKGYSQLITTTTNNRKEIKKLNNSIVEKNKLFSYEQIDYLWNFTLKSNGRQKNHKQYWEEFIRDFWLMLIYTGMRADELLSVYNANIFLDDNYLIGGLKTDAGINREIPIHPAVKTLFQKYYNPKNEFLFTRSNGMKVDYAYYFYHFQYNFEKLHSEVSDHTAHDARHTLRNELRKINIKDIIINSIIGHSNNDVGEDIYSHVSIEEKLEAIKMITYKQQKKLYILASNQ